jgi:ABC-type polar amino acid transport system ATPase subunit
MITVENLVKDYGDGAVLKNINLTFNPQEITVIMGPSGSGKSTLLRCLNFLEVPTEGSVNVLDTRLKEDPKVLESIRQRIAMVFQSFYLFDHLSAIDNCALAPRHVLKLSKDESQARALNALKEVGMAEFLQRKPSQLSGGQKQRVAIARALAMNPEVILFDEPTSALDPENVGEVLATMSALTKKHMSMILVTHEMQFAKKIADRIIFMDQGEVIEDRPAVAFFQSPNSDKAKRFLAHLA